VIAINNTLRNEDSTSAQRLRAIIEIVGGELRIYPITDNAIDEKTILDALRFVTEDGAGR
jgi:hypothetical protein